MNFNKLPKDVVSYLLMDFDIKSIYNVLLVGKKINISDMFWMNKCSYDFNEYKKSGVKMWKHCYIYNKFKHKNHKRINLGLCSYIFTRGKHMDRYCDDKVSNNSYVFGSDIYCDQCLKKKTVKYRLNKIERYFK